MKQRTLYQKRERRIEFVKRRLLRKSMPRIQMSLILVVTGFAGFFASFCLLNAGLFRMWIRYPIAILIAYGVFLLLLRLWLWVHGRSLEVDIEEVFQEDTFYVEPASYDGGGDFAGGGAGGSWGESVTVSSSEVSITPSSSGSGSSGSWFDLDLEEGWLLVIAVIAIIGAILASLYIVYIAPVLLAEILIDGVLLVGLYKRVKRIDRRHWLRAAVRRTILSVVLAALLFSLAGFAMQRAVPEARSIGEVWNHIAS